MSRSLATSMFTGLITAIFLHAGAGLSPATAQELCGTRLLPEHVPIVRERIEAGIYDLPEPWRGALYVPVTFHVVRQSDGTGGLDDVRLVQALDDANLAFANSGIRFCWVGPTDYIDDDDFYFNIDTMAEIDALRTTNVVADTVNIYFTENLAYEGGGLCGISSFTFSDVQGVVMRNSCTATEDNHTTFPHEIGHYFDLFHTHETFFGSECPDCVDPDCVCSVAGDLLCDTPADPQLGSHNVDPNCVYFGAETDPCAGSLYNPEPGNLMSYAPSTCRHWFTNQQNFRMQATLTRLRPELIAGSCPGDNHWNLDGKLTAADGAAGDVFGYSVSLSGDTALIGAHFDDDNGGESGSAYVFEKVGGIWVQVAKLTAADGAAGDHFGWSTSLLGDTALIGAYSDDDHGTNSGSAYVFQEIGGVWVQVAKLTAADGATYDRFGCSVALSGDTALIGAWRDDDYGTNSGSAYVFRSLDALRPPSCPGDLDGDDDVDLADLAELLGNYGETGGMTYEDGDLDGDGDVDLADLAELLGVYGEVCE